MILILLIVVAVVSAGPSGYIFTVNDYEFYPDWQLTHNFKCGDIAVTTGINFTRGEITADVPVAIEHITHSLLTVVNYSGRLVISAKTAAVRRAIITDHNCDYSFVGVTTVPEIYVPIPGSTYTPYTIAPANVDPPADDNTFFTIWISIVAAAALLAIISVVVIAIILSQSIPERAAARARQAEQTRQAAQAKQAEQQRQVKPIVTPGQQQAPINQSNMTSSSVIPACEDTIISISLSPTPDEKAPAAHD